MIPATTTWDDLSEGQRNQLLRRPALAADAALQAQVTDIIATVRHEGDTALLDLTERLDRVRLSSLRVAEEEFSQASQQLSVAALGAIDTAIANIRRFHEVQLPAALSVETIPGVRCERISHALDSVGLYVPAGSAPLPSTAIMLGVPASLAGCPETVLCTPPRPDGLADPAVLVAARRCGIQNVFKVGGAQAIAAMAFGTESVPKVRKIFGPGNAWVTEAKTIVSRDADGAAIDMPAGPSEVLVLADDSADAAFVAADLLSQAEHGVDSQVLLVTTSVALADEVRAALAIQLPCLSRQDIAAKSLQHCRIIVAADIGQGVEISNRYAPEHLIVQTSEPRTLLASIRNAGSVFLGPWSPESAGDYCSGTNHVLPTYGFAASSSGLSVRDFMRETTIQELTRAGLESLAPAIETLAGLEGLDAHAKAVRVRLEGDAA